MVFTIKLFHIGIFFLNKTSKNEWASSFSIRTSTFLIHYSNQLSHFGKGVLTNPFNFGYILTNDAL